MNLGETLHVVADNCPNCNHKLDAATCCSDDNVAAPREDDLTICSKCSSVLKFGPNLKLKMLSSEELAIVKKNDIQTFNMLQKAKTAIQFLQMNKSFEDKIEEIAIQQKKKKIGKSE